MPGSSTPPPRRPRAARRTLALRLALPALAVLTACAGLIAPAGAAPAATVGASTRAAAQPAAAEVLDVDLRDGEPTDHAQGLRPTVLGEPTASADLDAARHVLSFDGVDDAVRYPFRGQFARLGQAMSLECAFRFDGARTASSGEAALCSSKEAGGFATVMSGTDVHFMIHVGGGYKSVRVPVETGRWHHTLAVWDGARLRLYLDGVQVRETAAAGAFRAPSAGADSFMLGADVNPSDAGQFFAQASIRTARIYSRAVSADDAAALALADREGPDAPQGDVLSVDFADGAPVDRAQGLTPRTFGAPRVRDDAPMGTTVAQFDGAGSAYLYPFEQQFPKLAGAMSVECVFKYDDDLQSGSEESRGNLCGAKEAGGFAIVLYGDRLAFNPHIGGSYRNTGTQVASGRWYHAVGTYDGSAVRLYVNGVLAATTRASGQLSSPTAGARNLVLGGDATGRDRANFFAPATMSRAQVFSRAVTGAEVLALGREAYAGRADDYRVALRSSTPADGERITRRTRFDVELDNAEGLGRDTVYRLDGEAIRPGDVIGAGLRAGDHAIEIAGHDVFGTPIAERIDFTSANIPTGGGTENDQARGRVRLAANAVNPSGGDVRTTFREADVVVAARGRQGVLRDVPATRDFTGDDERPVDAPVAPGDGESLQSPSTGALPFQQFDVPVTSGADQRVIWTGDVDPAREVVLRVWNGEEWEEVARARGRAEGQVQLEAGLDARHRHDGVVPVLVTGEDPFADDLPNEIADAFERPGDYDFALAHLTDTQYLSEGAVEQETEQERAVWREAYAATTRWIAANAAERKIAFTAHTGDIIENWHNAGDDEANARAEFEVASAHQRTLDEAGMVNTVLPGNHDNQYGTDNGPDAVYNDYFGPDRYQALQQTASWRAAGAVHQPWKPGDNANNYVLFSAGGLDFVVVSLGFGVDAEEAAWADGVLKQYGDRNAIVLTHAYLTPSVSPDGRGSGFSFDGRAVLDGVVRRNANVALVLSGHEHGVSIELRRDVAERGHHVVELLADYQFYKVDSDEVGLTGVGYASNTPLQLGAAFFRLLQFDVDAGEVAVDTYSPLLKNFGATEYDDRNRYDGREDDTRLPIGLSSRTTSVSSDGLVVVDPTERVIGEATARSGWPAQVEWTGLESGRTYAWQATSVDAASGADLVGEVSQLSLFTADSRGTDTVPPVISLPETTRLTVGDDFDPLAGVDAHDEVDGDLTAALRVVGEVDTARAGEYALTYLVADANGNQALVSRVVEVAEAPAPVSTRRPAVLGTPRAGQTLRADLGTWSAVDGAQYTARWMRDGRPIAGAEGGDYRVRAGDVGRALSVRVSVRVGDGPAVSAESPARRVAKAPSSLRASAVRTRLVEGQRNRIDVAVWPSATSRGEVQLRRAGRVIANARVDGGRARLSVPALRPGLHRLHVVYGGNGQVEGRSVAVTVRVTPRR